MTSRQGGLPLAVRLSPEHLFEPDRAAGVIRAKGGRLGNPTAYAEVMKELPTLSGEFVQSDGSVVTRTGEDFWKVGSVASGFSGDQVLTRSGHDIPSAVQSPANR